MRIRLHHARDLSGRVIVITGASSGIGAATAVACAAAGMDVVVAARRESKLAVVARQVQHLGRRVLPVVCDVDRIQDVNRLFDQTLHEFGRLDVLFANAGRGLIAPVMETTEPMLKALFETNFYGTHRCVQAAVKIMRRSNDKVRGHVLICTSCVSEIALPRYGAYCATKAAQDSIGQSLRAELAQERIEVSTVHPVTTDTEFFDRAREQSSEHRTSQGRHKLVIQSADHVARRVVRCLRRPRAEVWPHTPTRYALAVCTAFPGLAAWAMRRMARHA